MSINQKTVITVARVKEDGNKEILFKNLLLEFVPRKNDKIYIKNYENELVVLDIIHLIDDKHYITILVT